MPEFWMKGAEPNTLTQDKTFIGLKSGYDNVINRLCRVRANRISEIEKNYNTVCFIQWHMLLEKGLPPAGESVSSYKTKWELLFNQCKLGKLAGQAPKLF